MIRAIGPLLLLLPSLLASPAVAQVGDYGAMYQQIWHNAGHEPMGEPRQTHDTAMCYAQRDRINNMLSLLPHSREESGIVMNEFINSSPRCHPEDRRFLIAGRFLRGATAEYLLKQARLPADVAPFAMPGLAALQQLDGNIRAPIVFIQIGECAARTNPDGVRALLAMDVGTPGERAAFGAVVPSLAGCVPSGVTFNLPPLLIRGYLAEGALRNAFAARAEAH